MAIKNFPYWWEAARPPQNSGVELPAHAEVVVIGAGYTGLSAALTLARAGRDVLVVDAEDPGTGASSRNAGYFGYELRTSLSVLITRFGKTTALELARTGLDAFAYSKNLIESEQIVCDLTDVGRLVCAHRPSHYESMAREAELVRGELGVESRMLSATELRENLGTDVYHGAKLLVSSYAMHPGKYLCGLLERVRSAGVSIVGNTRVTAVDGVNKTILTERGRVSAEHIVVATNGYTGNFVPALRRRLIPIGSHIIATEELDTEMLRVVFPVSRVAVDTRKLIRAFRPSPDGKRILFAGRVSARNSEDRQNTERLRKAMIGVFPMLRDVAITHSWGGYVGFTFDHLPHLGKRDGIHYALGFNGAGSTMGPYLGHKIAMKIIGGEGSECRLDGFEFETRPLYTGNPWFLPALLAGYGLIDRLRSKP